MGWAAVGSGLAPGGQEQHRVAWGQGGVSSEAGVSNCSGGGRGWSPGSVRQQQLCRPAAAWRVCVCARVCVRACVCVSVCGASLPGLGPSMGVALPGDPGHIPTPSSPGGVGSCRNAGRQRDAVQLR